MVDAEPSQKDFFETCETFSISEGMASALRTGCGFTQATRYYLRPQAETWVGRSGSEVTVGGTDRAQVLQLVQRYRRADELVRRHGIAAFDSAAARDFAPEFFQAFRSWMENHGLVEVLPGTWRWTVSLTPKALSLLRGPLRWCFDLASALRLDPQIRGSEVWLARVYDLAFVIRDDLQEMVAALSSVTPVVPSRRGLGLTEFVVAGAHERPTPVWQRYLDLTHQAATTGEWCLANAALELARVRPRIVTDPTGRIPKAFFWHTKLAADHCEEA